jgi:protein gp37
MGTDTKIEWCDHSWSPWRGCTKVSPGCANCYAETLSKRNPAVLGQWGRGKPRVLAKNWGDPVRWNRPDADGFLVHDRPTVFPSLCDWLDDEVPVEWLAEFMQLIHDTPNLRWLLLTKRPENFFPRLDRAAGHLGKLGESGDKAASDTWGMVFDWIKGIPPSNVWVGASVEDQKRSDERIPALLRIPAVGRFLSVEPLLGEVDVNRWLDPIAEVKRDVARVRPHPDEAAQAIAEAWEAPRIRWVIIGGESGPGSRPCSVDWIRSLVRQCRVAGVPAFVKQLGKHCEAGDLNLAPLRVDEHDADDTAWLRLTHPKGGDPAEWPEDLRVREFPEGLR